MWFAYLYIFIVCFSNFSSVQVDILVNMLDMQKRINGVNDNKRYMEGRIAVREKLLAQGIIFLAIAD